MARITKEARQWAANYDMVGSTQIKFGGLLSRTPWRQASHWGGLQFLLNLLAEGTIDEIACKVEILDDDIIFGFSVDKGRWVRVVQY